MKIEVTAHPGVEAALRDLSSKFEVVDNRVRWDALNLHRNTFLLASNLKVRPRPKDYIFLRQIQSALDECAKKGSFDKRLFVRLLRAGIARAHTKPSAKFRVLAQLNIPVPGGQAISLPSVHGPVRVLARLGKRIQAEIDGIDAWDRSRLSLSDRFRFLESIVSAKDGRSAVDTGHENIQFCLGVLNAVFDGSSISFIRTGLPAAPIGKFLRYSATISFELNSNKFSGWFVEPRFPSDLYISSFSSTRIDWENARKAMEWTSLALKKVDFRERLIQAILKYQEGVSSCEIESCLINLWNVIELICSTEEETASTDKIIRRASAIFYPPEHARSRLRFIADVRNEVVHATNGRDDLLIQSAEWAKTYASQLIQFAIWNNPRIVRHAEIIDYLSLGDDEEGLRRGRSLITHRIKALRRRKPPGEQESGER